MTSLHPTAQHGFVDGKVYELGRASYPPAAVDLLELSADDAVVDVGCGTGKFTRLVAETEARVIGVEPLPSMIATFREHTPGVPVVSGQAEALPFRREAFSVVACASTFHWFRHSDAIPEIYRVLRDHGRLVIVWNRRDKFTGWTVDLWQIIERHRKGTPSYRSGEWRAAIENSELFGPIREHRFDHIQTVDLDALLARVASISFIETSPDRDAVLVETKQFVESHPETRDRTTFDLPYETTVYVCERR